MNVCVMCGMGGKGFSCRTNFFCPPPPPPPRGWFPPKKKLSPPVSKIFFSRPPPPPGRWLALASQSSKRVAKDPCQSGLVTLSQWLRRAGTRRAWTRHFACLTV